MVLTKIENQDDIQYNVTLDFYFTDWKKRNPKDPYEGYMSGGAYGVVYINKNGFLELKINDTMMSSCKAALKGYGNNYKPCFVEIVIKNMDNIPKCKCPKFYAIYCDDNFIIFPNEYSEYTKDFYKLLLKNQIMSKYNYSSIEEIDEQLKNISKIKMDCESIDNM